MIPPPPEFADYHTETRGRSRNPKELPYFTYSPSSSPSSSPSRSSASSDAGDSGFSRTFDLGPALEDHHRRQTGQGNGLGLSFGTPSNQVSLNSSGLSAVASGALTCSLCSRSSQAF